MKVEPMQGFGKIITHQEVSKDTAGPEMRVVHEQPPADLQSPRRVVPIDEHRWERVTAVE